MIYVWWFECVVLPPKKFLLIMPLLADQGSGPEHNWFDHAFFFFFAPIHQHNVVAFGECPPPPPTFISPFFSILGLGTRIYKAVIKWVWGGGTTLLQYLQCSDFFHLSNDQQNHGEVENEWNREVLLDHKQEAAYKIHFMHDCMCNVAYRPRPIWMRRIDLSYCTCMYDSIHLYMVIDITCIFI